MPSLGKALRAIRISKGMTQAEVGEAANISPNYVGYIEADKRDPGWSTVLAMADALDVSITTIAALADNKRSGDPNVFMMQVARDLMR